MTADVEDEVTEADKQQAADLARMYGGDDLLAAAERDHAESQRRATPRPEPGPPPELDHDAPHGRDSEGKPLEPFGRTKDGKIRLRQGRPAKDQPQPPAGPPAGGPPSGGDGKDRTGDLLDLARGLWLGLTLVSPADAGALSVHAPAMAAGWNKAAQGNDKIAAGIDWLCESTWVVAVISGTVPFALSVAANHGFPVGVTKEQAAEMKAALEARTKQDMEEFQAQMAQEMMGEAAA